MTYDLTGLSFGRALTVMARECPDGVALTIVARDGSELDLSWETLERRANQIALQMREELHEKLEEFSSHSDNLEEIFENREQIEVSKFYEKLPKPTLIAIQEFLDEKGEFFIFIFFLFN